MFIKKEKSSFKYWFAHWCAYQMTALNCKAWRFKYLFHDIEKPFLELFWNHQKVKNWHRKHNTHHIEYPGKKKKDYEAIIIDWECSRFTKEDRTNNAQEELFNKYRKGICSEEEYFILLKVLKKLGLYKEVSFECENCVRKCKREKIFNIKECEFFVKKVLY